jgi:VIT1/CCC1 family predicted Fe2+/Mn2+ transporter
MTAAGNGVPQPGAEEPHPSAEQAHPSAERAQPDAEEPHSSAEGIERHEVEEHDAEPHGGNLASRLNWLRAGVLGANDGIVSTAGLVAGVAGATSERMPVLTAGVAGLVAGALSMAGGEYVSVSAQRDTERSQIRMERWELAHLPKHELEELTATYREKGLSHRLAHQVATELTEHDALAAHAEAELGIDPESLTSPWRAAGSSFLAFTVGALLPLVAILMPPAGIRVGVCVGAVAAALALTGVISARLGQSPRWPAIGRNVGVGLLAMGITYGVGRLFGATTG